MTPQKHRVVIVGGGFGGMNAARTLAKLPIEITLVDKRNFHLFQPLLYQVATGGLSPGDITAPLRGIVSRQKNVRVLLDEVVDFDVEQRKVILSGGTLDYDSLVLATGAENFYFGHDEWEQFAPALKTIEDATEIRRRILLAFESAEREPDAEKRRAWIRFVIVGGGATGVELAGAISEIARDTLRDDFRTIRPAESQIMIIEGSPRVLPPFQPDLSEKAERALHGLGVLSRTGLRVTEIDSEGVTVLGPSGEERIASKTVLWAAGVRASSLGKKLAEKVGAELDRGDRVIVRKDMTIPGHPELFVLGDAAHFEQDGAPLPGQCPVAMQMGWHMPKAIGARLAGKPLPEFHYVNKGTMATIGRHAAVCDLGFVRFDGFIAWLLWLFLHLLYLVGFQNRVLVAAQWAFQYFTFNRGARLITGEKGQRLPNQP